VCIEFGFNRASNKKVSIYAGDVQAAAIAGLQSVLRADFTGHFGLGTKTLDFSKSNVPIFLIFSRFTVGVETYRVADPLS
jgi:hypothetical protein